jgi:suppressor for copper-sensitivity B
MNASKIAILAAAALALLATGPRPARAAASEWSVNDQSKVRLITAWKVAPRDGELWMGLQFHLSPGWHVYWKNSGDAGFPPSLVFQPADRLGSPELLWPTPHRFNLPGGLVAFGYADEVVYPIRARIQPAAPEATPAPAPAQEEPDAAAQEPAPEALTITADLDYLICQVDCVPYRYALTLEQPLGDAPEADPEAAPLVQAWLDRLPRLPGEIPGASTGAVLDASRPAGPDLEIRVLGARGTAGKTDLFLEASELLDAGRPRMKVTPDGVVFHVAMKPRDVNKPLPARIPLAWTVSNLLARDGKSVNLEARRDVDVWTRAGGPAGGTEGEAAGPAGPAGTGRLSRLLLAAFLGGALLNLMPPVLALLLAELLALRGSGASSAAAGGTAREGAAAATTGVVGSAWIAAALAVATRSAGLPAAGGAFLAVVAAVVALNLWGMVEYPLAPSGSAGGTGRHLLAGLLATPLALAWPLPVLREPLAYAASRGPAAMAGIFALVGFGLALPYLLIAAAPALLRTLPEVPGNRLARLREGLGFLAAAGAFWSLYSLSRQVSPEGLAFVELALLALALFAWLRHRQGPGRALRAALALGLLACAAAAPWLAARNRLARDTSTLDPNVLPRAALERSSKPTSGG